ncbi:MAG: von Willebrand factor (vWA) type A protein, partial [uncultured bacterium]
MKIFGVIFAAFQNLVFLPILVILIIFLIWRFLKTKNIINKLGCESNKSRKSFLFKNYSSKKNVIKLILLITAVIFIFVALLRPQFNIGDKKQEFVNQKGRDLFIAIDISRSMLAQDLKPNRLEFAKQKIKKLVSNLKAERVCLIIFSGASIVQCPLTSDYGAFFMFLDQLDVETISSGTTALDQPINQVLSVLNTQKNKKTKLLVIFTDGEDFSSNLAYVREQAVSNGLKIFTMGVGTVQGAPIPFINEMGEIQGHIKDDSGKVVISKLNEGILNI